MLAVVSPAKSLDLTSPLPEVGITKPRHTARAWELVKTLRTLSLADLSGLMGISDELAALNATRYATFRARPRPQDVRPAILTFNGDVYQGFDAAGLTPAQLESAQDRLRILSGLYGVLRPLDGIQPYRLEMGTRLATGRGRNLYEFWGRTITDELRRGIAPDDVLVNLASNEYFSAVDPVALRRRVVTCSFTDEGRGGQYRIVSFFAKRARGLMARFIVTEQPSSPADLQAFALHGYAYSAADSSDDRLVFRRSVRALEAHRAVQG
jgi:cytoplasmic iron level regulating protein YaaA (DUF328/UPF0246 family)